MALDRVNPDAFVDQFDTIVLPEHRGHRLGMLVKAANLLQVRRAAPTATSIVTWNAAENRHMLAVNEALGFYPILISGGFEAALEE
jgi:GNAT superfamily N-acetyltransferase